VKCWGDNESGQLGVASSSESSVPVDVPGLSSGVVALAPGCALTSAGAVLCWGAGLDGGVAVPPAVLPGLSSNAAALSTNATLQNGCARLTSGGIRCWGNNANGQLGNGTTTASAVPVDVFGF
jgi:alpha-tubulin suppressor-like RCC1 family protein